ncbi:hypothetical protein [Pectobacterium versatile]|uniref:hypothetical protein n=1 Tax=Pectobacterium versatile TaxID=2488639 RepID=UPI00102EEDD2|nr:hypothetical protein [Pectobacterium versatile]TAI80281.1 hypothetical protein EG330_20815 [Pectobacterium versatile]
MNQRKNQKKTLNLKSNISRLGMAVKAMPGVSEFSEKKPISDNPINSGSYIGSFSFNERNMNYILINSREISFINFRMNLTYKKSDIPEEIRSENDLLKHIDSQNSKTIGIKTFLAKETDDEFVISVNSEYILDIKNESFKFIHHVINILSISPGILKITKSEG